MCGRYTLSSASEIVAEVFELTEPPDLVPRYNIAPTQTAPVVLLDGSTGERSLRPMRWGFIPSWAKDPKIGARMINARAETVAKKPSFRNAFRHWRCLVVADGFYEWTKSDNGKRPYHIRVRDGGPFAFAGLWTRWSTSGGANVDSYTIITTEPNELTATLHHRMPVILHQRDYAAWLDPEEHADATLAALLRPYASEGMEAYPVATLVNSPSHDAPDCAQRC